MIIVEPTPKFLAITLDEKTYNRAPPFNVNHQKPKE
ncbi:hypothetical protein Save01_07712 [Streptomyces avermitilis]